MVIDVSVRLDSTVLMANALNALTIPSIMVGTVFVILDFSEIEMDAQNVILPAQNAQESRQINVQPV